MTSKTVADKVWVSGKTLVITTGKNGTVLTEKTEPCLSAARRGEESRNTPVHENIIKKRKRCSMRGESRREPGWAQRLGGREGPEAGPPGGQNWKKKKMGAERPITGARRRCKYQEGLRGGFPFVGKDLPGKGHLGPESREKDTLRSVGVSGGQAEEKTAPPDAYGAFKPGGRGEGITGRKGGISGGSYVGKNRGRGLWNETNGWET